VKQRKWFLFLINLLFAFFIGQWLLNSDWILLLSPQGTISPRHLSEEFDPQAKEAIFNNQKVEIPPLIEEQSGLVVLGQSDAKKRIVIDLTRQRLYGFENNRLVYNFLISSGKWGRTPTGVFHVWVKLRSSKMEGGSRALRTYYYLPNVPYVMYFYNEKIPKRRGFGIHGTYWHDNFGHPMSHGCINMKTEEAKLIYYWAQPDLRGKQSVFISKDNPGIEITIYGKAPRE